LSPAPFKVRSEQEEGVFVIAVEGELDMNTAADLERELEGAARAAGAPLLIDLGSCEFIDSTGIALLVRSRQELKGDGNFAICGPSAQVKRVLDVTGLQETIPTHPSREEALARLRA
jgi:anti-anti-sigma factor